MQIRDEWPDEPDEADPEARWGDPERDLVAIPEAPSPPDPSTNDVPKDVSAAFWSVVVLVNLGVFALSLGPMLLYFRGETIIGLALVAVGVLSMHHSYRVYRRFKTRND